MPKRAEELDSYRLAARLMAKLDALMELERAQRRRASYATSSPGAQAGESAVREAVAAEGSAASDRHDRL
jgi:hypothetical protein